MVQQRVSFPLCTYVPECGITQITTRHMMGKVPVVMANEPDHICGFARRIGYTGKTEHDLAIYRLKVACNGKVITLPALFVVDGGIFVDYEQWCLAHKPAWTG